MDIVFCFKPKLVLGPKIRRKIKVRCKQVLPFCFLWLTSVPFVRPGTLRNQRSKEKLVEVPRETFIVFSHGGRDSCGSPSPQSSMKRMGPIGTQGVPADDFSPCCSYSHPQCTRGYRIDILAVVGPCEYVARGDALVRGKFGISNYMKGRGWDGEKEKEGRLWKPVD